MSKDSQLSKVKIYAIFQFLSLLATLSFVVFFADIAGSGLSVFRDTNGHFVLNFVSVLSFGYTAQGVAGFFASFFLYLCVSLQISAWCVAFMISRLKKHSLYDSLFFLFFMIPLVSNVITLAAQITKKHTYVEENFDDEKVYNEIKLELNKHRIDELTTMKSELDTHKTSAIEIAKHGEKNEKEALRNAEEIVKIISAQQKIEVETKVIKNQNTKLSKKIKEANKSSSDEKHEINSLDND